MLPLLSSQSQRIALTIPLRPRSTYSLWPTRTATYASDTQAGPSKPLADSKQLEQSPPTSTPSGTDKSQLEESSVTPSSSSSKEQSSPSAQWHKKFSPTNLNDFASQFRERMVLFSATTRAMLSQLGGKINHVTGYEEIDALKRQVVQNGAHTSFIYTCVLWLIISINYDIRRQFT